MVLPTDQWTKGFKYVDLPSSISRTPPSPESTTDGPVLSDPLLKPSQKIDGEEVKDVCWTERE